MTTELFLRYVHFVSILAIAGSLVSEHVVLQKEMTSGQLSRLAKIDAVYGVASLTLLAAGLTLWLGSYGKPAVVYTRNWIFLTKISLVGLIGLLSIYPTVFFLKNLRGNREEKVPVPTVIFMLLRLELLLLLIIPFLAGLMARGVGYFG